MNLPPCREYQTRALDVARSHVAAGKQSILLCMPTGTGKTRTAVEACIGHVKLGGVPMFIAPRRELVQQATKTLEGAGLEPGHDCFVRTIQELTSPRAVIPPATLGVLDEARHYVADEWSAIKKALPDALWLGLDATPERGDGRGLAPFFDVIVEAISIRDAIAGGFLVPCETIRPEHCLGPDLAEDPFDCWWHYAEGESTVIFERSVDAAKKLAARFYDRGIPAAAVWGDMPGAERDNALQLFAEGKLSVLTNVQLLTEGWDCPRTGAIILAAPCATQGGLLQRAGRGLRPYPGKKRMLLIDPTGCTHTLGDVDEPRTWHLDGKAARRAADGADVRFCPVCGAPTEDTTCAQCGHSGEMKKRRPRVLGLPMDRFARERQQTDEEKAKALAGYFAAARRNGRQRWWAIKCFEGKYGHKPTEQLKTMAMRVFLSG